MQIQLNGENIDIDQSLENLVRDKLIDGLDKYLKDFSEDTKIAHVKIEKRSRWGYKVNFNMWLPGKEHVYAEEKNSDLQSAIVAVREDLERQLKKYKRKIGPGKETIRTGQEVTPGE